MKLAVSLAVALVCVVAAEATIGGKFLSLDDREKKAEITDFNKKDKFKENDAFKKLDKESDNFALKKGEGSRNSVKASDSEESIVKFNDFENKDGKNELSKDKNFGLKLIDESNLDSKNEFKSSRGTDFTSKKSSSRDKEQGREEFDNEKLDIGSEAEKKSSSLKDIASENLLKDQSESLFDEGLLLEFAFAPRRHHRPSVRHGAGGLPLRGLNGINTHGLPARPAHQKPVGVTDVGVDGIRDVTNIANVGESGAADLVGDVTQVDDVIGDVARVDDVVDDVLQVDDVVNDAIGLDGVVGAGGLDGVVGAGGLNGVVGASGLNGIADGTGRLDNAVSDAIPPEVERQISRQAPNLQLKGRLSHILSRTNLVG